MQSHLASCGPASEVTQHLFCCIPLSNVSQERGHRLHFLLEMWPGGTRNPVANTFGKLKVLHSHCVHVWLPTRRLAPARPVSREESGSARRAPSASADQTSADLLSASVRLSREVTQDLCSLPDKVSEPTSYIVVTKQSQSLFIMFDLKTVLSADSPWRPPPCRRLRWRWWGGVGRVVRISSPKAERVRSG